MNDASTIREWPRNRAVTDALAATLESVPAGKPSSEVRTLVMLSGGIDSVAVLAAVLAGTDHRVQAHHIELANRDQRARAEADAVADVVEYCWRQYRDFEFTSSRHDIRISSRGYDLIITMFSAALACIASRRPTDFVMTGHFLTQKTRVAYGGRMLQSCFLRDSSVPRWLRPLDALPDRRLAKIDIVRSVPPALVEMTWSCRRPARMADGFAACGKCYACRNLRAALDGVPAVAPVYRGGR
jgi:hypothetical protein